MYCSEPNRSISATWLGAHSEDLITDYKTDIFLIFRATVVVCWSGWNQPPIQSWPQECKSKQLTTHIHYLICSFPDLFDQKPSPNANWLNKLCNWNIYHYTTMRNLNNILAMLYVRNSSKCLKLGSLTKRWSTISRHSFANNMNIARNHYQLCAFR